MLELTKSDARSAITVRTGGNGGDAAWTHSPENMVVALDRGTHLKPQPNARIVANNGNIRSVPNVVSGHRIRTGTLITHCLKYWLCNAFSPTV